MREHPSTPADKAHDIAWNDANDEQDRVMFETADAGKATQAFWDTYESVFNRTLRELNTR